MTHSPDGASAGGLELDELEKQIRLAVQRATLFNSDGSPYGVQQAADDAWALVLRALSPSPGLGGGEVHLAPNVRGQEPRSSVLTSTPCQSEWEERLTAQTCGFAQHIDREGEGWSEFRHSDVCAALGEVERLRRGSATARSTTFWRDDALSKSAEIVRRWFGADGEGCAKDIEALSSEAPSPKSEPQVSAGKEARDDLIPPGFVVAPREVVEPFYRWAKDNVAAEEDGGYIWSGLGCQNERIRVWFGPSEFGRLAEVFAALPPPGGGKGAYSTDIAAAGPSACAATAPQCKSEEG